MGSGRSCPLSCFHGLISEGIRPLEVVWMAVSADDQLDARWIDSVSLQPVEKVVNPVSVSGINQKRDFPIDENTVAVVLARVSPKVHIKVFGNFHWYQAFVSTGR